MAPPIPERGGLPSYDDLVSFVSGNPGRASKREIVRAFGIRGSHQRAELNRMLRELRDEGRISLAGRSLEVAGALPRELVVEVVGIDDDGTAIAEPSAWHAEGPPPRIALRPRTGRRPAPAPGLGERAVVELRRLADGSHDGRVRRLIGPEALQIVGVLKMTPGGPRIRPADRRQAHDYRAELPRELSLKDGDLVLAEPLSARRFGPVPARVVGRLGVLSDAGAASRIAIAAHGIPTRFPEAALAEAARAEPVATPCGRQDLRSIPLVTIDDADARDHDDAVFAEPACEAGAAWHAIVAIADVAHYVHPGSELDRAARERGNSVYFPDLVVPMLPESLSNDLCSLRPLEDRACLAVDLWIGADGELRRWRFARSVMRSAARLTYDEVEAHRNGQPSQTTGSLPKDLIGHLHGVHEALRRARGRRGAIDIERPERRIVFDGNGRVRDIVLRERHDSHRLIEELMIAANVAAARELGNHRLTTMYRVHDQPSPEKADALREYLETLGLSLRRSPQLRPSDFAGVLARVGGSEFKEAVHEAVLRSQSQAAYDVSNIGHFGLGLPAYCHFTSPIRRYADLLVHRALISTLDSRTGSPSDDAGSAPAVTGQHLTATERRAVQAERDAMDRHVAAYLAERVGTNMTGRIVGVGRFGLFVRTDDLGADGLLPARRLPGGPFAVHENARQLAGDGIVFRLGDPVTVRLVEADPVAGRISFELVEGGTNDDIRHSPREPARRVRRHGAHRRGRRRR